MKVLIVDDDPNVRNVLRQVVENHGHAVIEAGDGQEGKEKALEYKPDAIISDILMPKMDGFQFLRAVRQNRSLSIVPFVFFTAVYTGEKEHELALALGADGLIVKPKTPDDFWKEFTSALDARASLKKQTAQAQLIEREQDYLRDYCQIVAAKLEEKVRALEDMIKLHQRMEYELRNTEKVLKRASDEWRSTFDAMGNAVALMDKDGKILRCNRAMAAMAGKDYSEIIGRHCWDVVHGTSVPIEACPHELMKKTFKKETAVVLSGASWFEVSVDPFFDNVGAFIGAVHIMTDVTERKQLEDDLKAAIVRAEDEKIRAESIIEAVGDGVTIQDRKFRILYQNKAMKNLIGDHTGELCYMAYEKKEERCEGCPVAMVFEDGKVHTVLRSALTDKGTIYVENTASPLRDSKGDIIAVIEVVHDIAKRKMLEEKLSRSTREWEEIFDTITDMVTIHDEDFNIIRANKAAQKILGLPFLEINNKVKCFEYYHGTGCPPEGCPSCQCLVTGKPSTFELFEPHLNAYIEIRAIPRLDSNNRIIGLVHVVRDISERKKSEEALALHSRELTELNTASNSLMLITNLGDIYHEICEIIYSVFDLKMVWLGIINDVNYTVEPVAHAGHEDGYLSAIRVTWDDSPTGMGPVGMAIKSRASFKMNINDPSFASWQAEALKRGYEIVLSVPIIYARDKCIGVLNFYSGDTEYFMPDRIKLCQIFANQAAIAIENARLVSGLETEVLKRMRELEDSNSELIQLNKELYVRRQEADAASRSKTDFLANMSHELRTPLNAILGFAEIIQTGRAGPVTEKQNEFLKDIYTSGEHLLSLITDILDLSKVEAGRIDLKLEAVDVKEIIESSLIMFKEKTLKHKIKIALEIDGAITNITADRKKLKQVIMNLLSNAFKFTPDGGSVRVIARKWIGALSSRTGEEKPSPGIQAPPPVGDFVEISIEDTGIGISEENLQKLFQSFQQIETSLTRKYSGTGLGLSLCRRFIELHGGRIWVESNPGKGSRFTFIIPVKQQAAKADDRQQKT